MKYKTTRIINDERLTIVHPGSGERITEVDMEKIPTEHKSYFNRMIASGDLEEVADKIIKTVQKTTKN